MDYNWLLFRIKNVNLPIKKIHSSLGRVENNFINYFSAFLKYQLYFQKNPLLLKRGDYNWDFVINAIYFHPAWSGKEYSWLLVWIKNINLNIEKIQPSSGKVDYNWLSFRIQNVNLPIKKIYSSSGKVENNFLNNISALS